MCPLLVFLFLRCSWSLPRSRKTTRTRWVPWARPSSGSGCSRTPPSPSTTWTASCVSSELARRRALAASSSKRPRRLAGWAWLLSSEVCMRFKPSSAGAPCSLNRTEPARSLARRSYASSPFVLFVSVLHRDSVSEDSFGCFRSLVMAARRVVPLRILLFVVFLKTKINHITKAAHL